MNRPPRLPADLGTNLSRRHFLRLGAGTVVVIGLGACTSERSAAPSTSATTALPSTTELPTTTTAAASSTAAAATTGSSAPGTLLGGRRLVVVQLNGGNDGLNTVVPVVGQYHDARPSLGLADTDLVALSGETEVGLHPALQPLVPLWDAGQLALVRGIGFQDPDRSHFVSMDRWWRADDVHAPGWLGRVLDDLPTEPDALYATALGGSTPILAGANRQGASVGSPSGFRFQTLDPDTVRLLSSPPSDTPLMAAAQHAFARAVDAVTDFDTAMKSADDDAGDDDREGGATIAGGLQLAARLLAADVGTQVVVVSAGGFDTHSGQADTQHRLLADFAAGVTAFFESASAAGLDVLLVTTSEFGRRVQENGSGGTDHGAGNVSFAVGPGVQGGVVGSVDLTDLLDGDVRPTVDPRTMYTACLDWIGADPVTVLGKRYDEVELLKR